MDDYRKFLDVVAQTIFDKKGFNIIALDVRGVCTMTDFFVIASGSVDRHVVAICDALSAALQERGVELLHVDGRQWGDWVVLDYGDVVIHLFVPEQRDKYQLEELWHKGTVVDVHIKI